MSEELARLFDSLDSTEDPINSDIIIRAPFGYPGGKSRSVNHILPLLPHNAAYVEPFGGTGAVLLARRPSTLEVLNDRYMGIVSFYRCIRDPQQLDRLCDRIEATVHSREEFMWCRDTWENLDDDVERAARWLYMIQYSFSQLGRNFGRSTSSKCNISGKLRNRVKEFPYIHQRLKKVQIENQDWYNCMVDYDSPSTVFYIDPPYVDAFKGTFKYELTQDDHRRLIDTVFNMQGFCAVSGYSNPLYDEQPWDDKHSWESYVSVQSQSFTEGNKKQHMRDIDKRGKAIEVLWIKEAVG